MKLAPILLILILVPGIASANELNIKLNLNDTGSNVYVPGVGEMQSSAIVETKYTNPLHFYVASYLNDIFAGIIASDGNSIIINKTMSMHTIGINQNMGKRTLLAFSEGDWKKIDNRIGLIEAGKFFSEISPSFSSGLGIKYPIKLILNYDFDIDSSLIVQKGLHNIIIENNGNSISIKE